MSCLKPLASWFYDKRLGIKPRKANPKPYVFYEDNSVGLILYEKDDSLIMQTGLGLKAYDIALTSEGLKALYEQLSRWQWFVLDFSGLETWIKESIAFLEKEGL